MTLEECFFFGLIPIHSIPAIALCVAMVAFGFLIGKPFAAFLWREDFALAKTLSSSTNQCVCVQENVVYDMKCVCTLVKIIFLVVLVVAVV